MLNFLLFGLDAEGAHGHLELFAVNGTSPRSRSGLRLHASGSGLAAVRKLNPDLYWDSKTQKQMREDAKNMGEAFFNQDETFFMEHQK